MHILLDTVAVKAKLVMFANWFERPLQPQELKPSDFPIETDSNSEFFQIIESDAWPQLSVQALRLGAALAGRDGILIFYMRESSGITWDLEAELTRIGELYNLQCCEGDVTALPECIQNLIPTRVSMKVRL